MKTSHSDTPKQCKTWLPCFVIKEAPVSKAVSLFFSLDFFVSSDFFLRLISFLIYFFPLRLISGGWSAVCCLSHQANAQGHMTPCSAYAYVQTVTYGVLICTAIRRACFDQRVDAEASTHAAMPASRGAVCRVERVEDVIAGALLAHNTPSASDLLPQRQCRGCP